MTSDDLAGLPVGVIGPGRVGTALALMLVEAGHRVEVDRRANRALRAAGGRKGEQIHRRPAESRAPGHHCTPAASVAAKRW